MKLFLGIGLILVSLFILVGTFFPILKEEAVYNWSSKNQNTEEIKPIDQDFGILIPKINANAKVIKNVDPFDPKKYQLALSQGVAHASGSALPDDDGNVFIFSHSSTDFFQATRYNSVFYLLSKLEVGDEVRLYYEKELFTYHVTTKKVVGPDEIQYLQSRSGDNKLTLMTCWPPGTSFKRLIIEATKGNSPMQ